MGEKDANPLVNGRSRCSPWKRGKILSGPLILVMPISGLHITLDIIVHVGANIRGVSFYVHSNEPSLIIDLLNSNIAGWTIVRCGSKNEHQKLREIQLHAQNMLPIPNATVDKIGERGERATRPLNEHEESSL